MYTHMTFTGKGFIGKAEVKTTNGGSRIGTLRVAVNNSWKDKTTGEKQESTHWFGVTVFAPGLLDMIEKGWLTKGRYVEVVGDLREKRWTDQTGEEHFAVQLMADTIRFLDRKPEEA